MTAELEADMDKIAGGEISKDEVVQISRKMLHDSYDLMDDHKDELAKIIWEGMNQDRILGPCWKCEEAGRKNEDGDTNRLRIIRAKKSGKRFVGCEGYPECDQTYGIPQRGDLWRLEESCSICGKTPRLRCWTGRRPWNLCLNEDCPTMVEMREKRAEREAAKAAKAAAKEAEDKSKADGIDTKPAKIKRATRSRAATKAAGSNGGKKRASKNGAAAKSKAKPKAPAKSS
jgi:DNA topoisomerase-1